MHFKFRSGEVENALKLTPVVDLLRLRVKLKEIVFQ